MNRVETNENRGLAWLESMQKAFSEQQDTVEDADLILELIQAMRPFMKCSPTERSQMVEDLKGTGCNDLQLAVMEHLLFGHEVNNHHFQYPVLSQQLHGMQTAA